MIKGAMKMEKELKKLKEKYNNSFDEINVIDVGYEYEEMRIEFRASFNDTNYKFYYNGDDFDDLDDYGGEVYFNSIEEIIDLIPEAKKYHKNTTHIFIHRVVTFVDKEDDIILLMEVGDVCIPTDELYAHLYNFFILGK